MTQDEIIEMARQAGARPSSNPDEYDVMKITDCGLESFAKLVAAKAFQNGYEKGIAAFTEAVSLEREACAKTLESISNAPDIQAYANAIRARGEQA
jgi:hypothetical protein